MSKTLVKIKNDSIKNKALDSLAIEFDREVDGRWIAEIPKLPGVMAYGSTKAEVTRRVYSIALRTLADIVEHGNTPRSITRLFSYDMAYR